jgi:ubiquinone/menaquinone biosynthesis C-methylase UbiE
MEMPDETVAAESVIYDQKMARSSPLVGRKFLDWLALPNGLRWLDIGCGTGLFTELILDTNAPESVCGIDPSESHIALAKSKPRASHIEYGVAGAELLPYGNDDFDVAVMALVIQYVPDQRRAMSEMCRVLRNNGTVAAYIWPGPHDGHPMQPVNDAVKAAGLSRMSRPGGNIRNIEGLVDLYHASGLEDIESSAIEFTLDFIDFGDYWTSQTGDTVADMTSSEVEKLRAALKERLPEGPNGEISFGARANAVKARVPEK